MKIRKLLRIVQFLLIPIYLYLVYFVVFLKNGFNAMDENWYFSKYWEESNASIMLSVIIMVIYALLALIEWLLKKREVKQE